MTRPGYVNPPTPGWWVRTSRVGTNANGYDWSVNAVGGRSSLGTASGRYSWAGSAVGSAGGVKFADAGIGYGAGGAGGSWAHTIAGNAIVAAFSCGNSSGVTCQVGSTPMTQIGSPLFMGSFYYYIFGLLAPPTGAQTITLAGGGLYSNGDSCSYNNVTTIGSLLSNTGSGPSLTHAVSAATGQMVFQVFGVNVDGTITTYNQTQRYFSQTSGQTPPVMIGDAPGASTVNFAAAAPSASWLSLAVVLS